MTKNYPFTPVKRPSSGGGSAGLFDPFVFDPNVFLWWDFADSGVYAGGDVTDKSGNNFDGQANAINGSPFLSSFPTNALQCAQAFGSDDFYTPTFGAFSYTMLWVINRTSPFGAENLAAGDLFPGSNDFRLRDTGSGYQHLGGSGTLTWSKDVSATAPSIGGIVYDGFFSEGYNVNGSAGANVVGISSIVDFIFGTWGFSGGSWPGYIAEVVIWDTSLSGGPIEAAINQLGI